MKMIDAPKLGPRPATEFIIAGMLEPEPAELDGITAGEWVFNRTSLPRERTEWWYHTPSQLWFLVTRDTASDRVLAVQFADDRHER
ncbi:MAG: sarcosine oxidase subunit delta [Gammaproteobacteria bacterium]|jgi:sarcosine oxidase subunit delta